MKHSTGKPTKAQKRRMDALSRMRCIACVLWGSPTDCGRVEVHHIVDRGTRALSGGHDATIPLGAFHHRGTLKSGWFALEMAETFGPSMQREKRAFIKTFGTERELLAKVNERLRQAGVEC